MPTVVDYPGAEPAFVNSSRVFGGAMPRFAIVIHKTAGFTTVDQLATYFQNDPSEVSSHFGIGTDGRVQQYVSLTDGAAANCCTEPGYNPIWQPFVTAGTNLNTVTISIEHIDPATDNSTPVTAAQKQASFNLVKWLVTKFNIPTTHILGHNSIDPINRANCPGNYPMDDLLLFLKGGPAMPDTLPYVNIGDGIGKDFTQNANGSWTCTQNKVILQGAMLVLFRMSGGIMRLPKANEVIANGYVYQECEAGIMVYDPNGLIDNPPDPPVHNHTYLAKLDSDLAKKLLGSGQVTTVTEIPANVKADITAVVTAASKLKTDAGV